MNVLTSDLIQLLAKHISNYGDYDTEICIETEKGKVYLDPSLVKRKGMDNCCTIVVDGDVTTFSKLFK
jgi:hypothetical protein